MEAAIAGRFAIEGEAGRGGMGTVFRARDATSGERVALKLLRDLSADDAERFARESAVLADLRHPAIVRYIAHGITGSGQPYLAMQWLEGETLGQRLARGPLPPADATRLLLRAAEGLAHAHERRVLHRDIKPSNLFLEGGDPARAMLVDFGVARWIDDRHPITTTGALIGTPGYMAPEQARGSRELDPRTDVFALGCVAYACLTGDGPFDATSMLATLFRILFEDPPPPRDRRPEVPPALDALVSRMIRKDPAARPRDAGDVAAALRALQAETPAPAGMGDAAITTGEQRPLSVVLVRPSAGEWRHGGAAEARLRSAADQLGGRVEQVADGSALVLFASLGEASDQAQRAARCALDLRALLPDAAIAVASGRAALAGRLPVGEVIDRAVRAAEEVTSGRIQVDDATAGLLDGRFLVATGPGGHRQLRAGRDEVVLARTVLGKATAMVGRERELEALEALAAESASGPIARAVVVTAPPGAGKTRLRQELVRRVVRRDARVEVLLGRGDPLRGEAPFALLGDAIRRTAGITSADAPDEQREKLAARIGRHMRGAGHIADFLGAVIGLDLPDIDDTLRAARSSHLLRYDQMRAGWLEWLAAEADHHPVILALEDLHWSDRPTVDFVDAALAQLADRPILVLALARPELRSRFPDLWDRRDPQQVRLAPLQKKAATRLVRDLLGEEVTDAQVSRIVDHSTGNPLFLEELVRAAAGGQTDALPDSVSLMLQARLDAIDSELRRVLRAASIFGESFPADGVQAVLGDRDAGRVADRLAALRAAELVVPRSPSADRDDTVRPGELYAFGHALVRDAAYATFTDEDRALGHRLAAAWLERRGDAEPAVLAEHFARGERPGEAALWFAVGAEAALAGGDMAAALDMADRGLALGAAGEVAGTLHRIAAEAHEWRGETADASDAAEQAVRLLPRGSAAWFAACDELFMASGKLRRFERAQAILMETFATEPLDAAAQAARVSAVARAAIVMIRFGSERLGEMAVAGLERIAGDRNRLFATARSRLATVHGLLARARGDVDRCMAEHEDGLAALQAVQDRRSLCYHLTNQVGVCAEVGELAEAERLARSAVTLSRRLGLQVVVTLSEFALGALLTWTGRHAESAPLLDGAIAAARASGEVRMLVLASAVRAEAALAAGDLAGAAQALDVALGAPGERPDPGALVALTRLDLARGDLAAAERHAAEAVAAMPRCDGIEVGESAVRTIEIEVLERTGRVDEGRERARAALDRLSERAARIQPRWREGFLHRVKENRDLLALAARLGVD